MATAYIHLKLPYSRKYWRSIKFGGLAVGEATVKFKSVKFKCDLRVCVRAYYMYGTTVKFKSTNIFISVALDQTAKLKDRQYFRLYGIWLSFVVILIIWPSSMKIVHLDVQLVLCKTSAWWWNVHVKLNTNCIVNRQSTTLVATDWWLINLFLALFLRPRAHKNGPPE